MGKLPKDCEGSNAENEGTDHGFGEKASWSSPGCLRSNSSDDEASCSAIIVSHYSSRPSSTQQSQVLLTIQDLANEKLLRMKSEVMATVERVGKEGSEAVTALSDQLSALADALREQKTLCILNSLDFETRSSRQSDISEIENKTFDWIFCDKHEPSGKPVGFKKWLQSGNETYWISGKAGSGKSVMMNYVANEPYTQMLLQSWAGEDRLIIAKYFFWNAGGPMQKSQQGLLQSLLREIYGQCPELVPLVSPSRWSRYQDIGATWNRLELAEAFRKLRQQRLLNLRFCLFIDGVDEYDGEDHVLIINILKDLSASAHIKVCLSSRPWNIFVAAFGTHSEQRLLLENHNEHDIRVYIRNRFENDEKFALLQSLDSHTSELVDQIVCNAQGVFLWVKIVVSNLLRGMSNDDSLIDLRSRLLSFPTTLKAYFQHMFNRIDEFYREETSELLLICLEALQPLSLLTLWFYEQEKTTTDYAMLMKREPLTSPNVTAIYERIHKRVNARGQDLLVIETSFSMVPSSQALRYTVRFSHRTVKDFLLATDITEKLHSWKSKGFNARVALCRASLAIVKYSLHHTEATGLEATYLDRTVNDFFRYASRIEQDDGSLDDDLVDELQRVVASYHEQDQPRSLLHRLRFCLAWTLDHWARWAHYIDTRIFYPFTEQSLRPCDRDMTVFFMALATEFNLNGYMNRKLVAMPDLIRRPSWGRSPMHRALSPKSSAFEMSGVCSDTIELLLKRGANPNETLTVRTSVPTDESVLYMPALAWTTVWALYLERLYADKVNKTRKSPALLQNELEATKLMIQNGADADLRPWRIPAFETRFNGRVLTTSDIFHEVFSPRNAMELDQLQRRHRPSILRQARSHLRRTIMLWFYRDITFVVWALNTLYSTFFNGFLGAILPMVIIPVNVYCFWLVWPWLKFLISVISPFLLPTLILSDWIPLLDGLSWVNNLLVWRGSSFAFNQPRQ